MSAENPNFGAPQSQIPEIPEIPQLPEVPFDPVLGYLGRLVAENGGFGGPKIGPDADAMAGALSEDQLGWVEARSRRVAEAEGRPLNAGWYSDAGDPFRRAASEALARGDRTEATKQLAMASTFNILGRRAHEAERATAMRRRDAGRRQ